jgi:hypothetical protein
MLADARNQDQNASAHTAFLVGTEDQAPIRAFTMDRFRLAHHIAPSILSGGGKYPNLS